MPSFTQPDPARAVAKLAADVAKLESTVRRGKPAANMRDLADGDLFDAEDGEVPVYDASIGRWRPGATASSQGIRMNFATQNIGTGAYITFSAVMWTAGTALGWSSGDPTRVTVAATGLYAVSYGAALTAHVGGDNAAYVVVDNDVAANQHAGSFNVYSLVPQTQGLSPTLIGTDLVSIGAGSSVRLAVEHGFGSALDASPITRHYGMKLVKVG